MDVVNVCYFVPSTDFSRTSSFQIGWNVSRSPLREFSQWHFQWRFHSVVEGIVLPTLIKQLILFLNGRSKADQWQGEKVLT